MAPEVNWPDLYPVFLKLEGASVLVVGAGAVGTRKVRGLVQSGARVVVVAPGASDEVVALADEGSVTWHAREFDDADVRGATLVFAATPSREVNALVAGAARGAGVWVNVADTPDLCSFYLPSVVDRAPLRIAVSTSGACPAYARELRRRLERQFPPTVAGFVELMGKMRETVRRSDPARVMEVSQLMVESGAEARWSEGEEQEAYEILESIVEGP